MQYLCSVLYEFVCMCGCVGVVCVDMYICMLGLQRILWSFKAGAAFEFFSMDLFPLNLFPKDHTCMQKQNFL